MALQTLPLRIRKIAEITRTHPSSLSQRFSPSFQNTVLEATRQAAENVKHFLEERR